ncbi:hypothetical protein TrLO_g758 [Triparma laevis f. longispina]|uniref:Choline transporter-like protein n=1 Tax=Triparma laevis f. longispina TaxID=1714387 RepID=A0A9W7F3S1_9STRA|nr:hypothetical protein TrLO_g758 [Triparma laevis f. longispina]
MWSSPDKKGYAQSPTRDNVVQNYRNKGVEQPNRFRDPVFALLFISMIIATVVTSIMYGPEVGEVDGDEANGWLVVAAIQGVTAIILGLLSLSFMIAFAESLIQITLIGSIILCFVASGIMFVEGLVGGGVIWLMIGLISCLYSYCVWHRIPFAAATLKTGLTAVKSNLGLMVCAIVSLFVAFGWTIWWVVNYLGIAYQENGGNDGDASGLNGGIVFALLICFYWAHQVISNVVHVTVAGTVGTWWFNPLAASSCCSTGVTSSLKRATTFSFGSICLGSLLVAILNALRAMVHSARYADDGIIVCIADCILGCLESIMEYFNRWAFIYCGLYGYSFMEAGKNVIRLFKARGWTMIINDDLVGNVLAFQSLGVGAICGGVGLLANEINPQWFDADGNDENNGDIDIKWIIFFIGLLIGALFSSIMFNVVQSAVDTTVVCFAEAPVDFQRNYPDLYDQMSESWLKCFPGLWSGEESLVATGVQPNTDNVRTANV